MHVNYKYNNIKHMLHLYFLENQIAVVKKYHFIPVNLYQRVFTTNNGI